MTHLASQGIGGHHVLLGPGSVDTGIHSKNLLSETPFWIKLMMKINQYFYHGTPEWASEFMAQAAMGVFDGELEDVVDDNNNAKGKKNSIQVVDLGKKLDVVLCGKVERNRDLYNAMMKVVEEEKRRMPN